MKIFKLCFNFLEGKLTKSEATIFTLTDNSVLNTDYNGMLRGLVKDPIATHKSDQFTQEAWFNRNSSYIHSFSLHLRSTDMQRGRDNGHSPFYVYLDLTQEKSKPVSGWNDLKGVISNKAN